MLPARKKALRQGLKPSVMRLRVLVPNGEQQGLRGHQRTNTTTELTAEEKLLVKAEVACTMARRETERLSRVLYGGHPYNAPYENVSTGLTVGERLLVQAEVKETMARRKVAEIKEAMACRKREQLEQPVRIVHPDFLLFTREELERPLKIAPPIFFDLPSPSITTPTLGREPEQPVKLVQPNPPSPSIATSAEFTAKKMLAEMEETVEQKLVKAETKEAIRARGERCKTPQKSPNTTPSMPTCWEPEQLFKAFRQDLFSPPSPDITTPEKSTAEQMQVAEAIRARGGSGVQFSWKTAEQMLVAEAIRAGGGSGVPLRMTREVAKALIATGRKPENAAALAAAGTNAIQFEEAVRAIYN